MPIPKKNPRIIVIAGGGVAAIHSALTAEKAEKAKKVKNPHHQMATILLITSDDDLGGTFAYTPGRMPHGYHYPLDLNTALTCLEYTIAFKHEYPDYFIDHGHSYEKGIYVVLEDSIQQAEEVDRVYQAIANKYKALVKENVQNKVYGPPNEFLKKLSKEEGIKKYPHLNSETVQAVYETQELLLDTGRYIQFLKNLVRAKPYIKIMLNTQVVNVSPAYAVLHGETEQQIEHANFILMLETRGKMIRCPADIFINATWHHAEHLADTLCPGAYEYEQAGKWILDPTKSKYTGWTLTSGEKRRNRLKGLARFKLLGDLRQTPSTMGVTGKGVMFANAGTLDRGYPEGFLTAGAVTNINSSDELTIDEETQRWLAGKLTIDEKVEYVKKLFKAGTHYLSALSIYTDELIHEMISVGKISVHFGIVKTFGPADEDMQLERIFTDPQSSIHQRLYRSARPDYPVLGATKVEALKGGCYVIPIIQEMYSILNRTNDVLDFLDSVFKYIQDNPSAYLSRRLLIEEKNIRLFQSIVKAYLNQCFTSEDILRAGFIVRLFSFLKSRKAMLDHIVAFDGQLKVVTTLPDCLTSLQQQSDDEKEGFALVHATSKTDSGALSMEGIPLDQTYEPRAASSFAGSIAANPHLFLRKPHPVAQRHPVVPQFGPSNSS